MSDGQGVGADVEATGTTRRRFMQAAAAVGVVGAVWTEPVIRGSVAGAQTGQSVDGSCTSLGITWSGAGNDDWLNMAMNPLTPAATFVQDASTPSGTYTWNSSQTACSTLTAPVTVFATGDPAKVVGGATVSIITGVSCMFANVVASVGTISGVMDTEFMYTAAEGAMSTISFDIVCG